MNFKKAALALAVSSVAAAPMVASADGEIYASVRFGLQYKDGVTGDADNEQVIVRNWASRLGMRGETELGNGWSGWGRYEFGVNGDGSSTTTVADNSIDTDPNTPGVQGDANTDPDTITDSSAFSLRHAVVGLKNDHNNIFLGHTYHTFYNYIVGPADVPWWGASDDSGVDATLIYSPSRTSRGLSYDGNFGVVSFGATAYMQPDNGTNESEKSLDAYEAAIGFNFSGVDLAFGLYDEDQATNDPDPVYALAASVGLDNGVNIAANYQQQDGTGSASDLQSLVVDVSFSDFYVHLETLNRDQGGADPLSITLGYTHVLGPRTLMWFELQNVDTDVAGADDRQYARAALKYDIL